MSFHLVCYKENQWHFSPFLWINFGKNNSFTTSHTFKEILKLKYSVHYKTSVLLLLIIVAKESLEHLLNSTVLNNWVWKLIQTLVDNIMSIAFLLNWIQTMLSFSKWKKHVSLKIIRSIYFPIFDSYLSYCCLAWAQNYSIIQRIIILQKKVVKIVNFQPRNSHTSALL